MVMMMVVVEVGGVGGVGCDDGCGGGCCGCGGCGGGGSGLGKGVGAREEEIPVPRFFHNKTSLANSHIH